MKDKESREFKILLFSTLREVKRLRAENLEALDGNTEAVKKLKRQVRDISKHVENLQDYEIRRKRNKREAEDKNKV